MTATAPTQDYSAVMKNALQQIRELKAKLAEAEKQNRAAPIQAPIALIGIGCRFPGERGAQDIRTPEAFWTFLCNGGNAVRETPADRWDVTATFDPDPATPGKTHIRHGCFLAQVDGFEPPFFNLAPREAITLDPQQRLLLETSWEALEHANLVPSTLVESATGVFVGISGSDYATLLLHNGSGEPLVDDLYGRTGVDSSVAAGRLSYVLGLTGPCIAVDTACSSSLVALHQACQSLRQHECDLALAGGVALMLSPENTIAFAKAGMLATDGRCKTFDAAADGYVRGEGCGMVVLKRLADAQADGDTILAVVRGSMINHDGPSSGLTVPRGPSQQAVIRQALKGAAIDPATVGYLEAHGTGTALGDPIELGALRAIFQKRNEPLWVGSVKTNLGHLEAAAGIAGLIKVVLMLQHGQIPPHLHFQTPNPHVDWANTPVQVPTTLTDWSIAQPGTERVAGISSFGYSGTNAHVVLSSPPEGQRTADDGARQATHHLLTIAAKNATGLQAYIQRYREFLAEDPALVLGDLCYSSQVARSHFPYRLALAVTSIAELQGQLAQVAQGETPVGVVSGYANPDQAGPKIAFLFTGQGAQYINMGRHLYETNATFRATLDRCEELYRAETGASLVAVLYPAQKTEDGSRPDNSRLAADRRQKPEARAQDEQSAIQNHKSQIDDTTYTQPALFALEVALATLWQSWGIQPDVVIGHSVGEVAAACVAGVFRLEDGMKLIAARGRLMGGLPHDGEMVSLMADEARVQAEIAPYTNEVSIAAINGPESVVIAGKRETVLAIAEKLRTEGIKSRRLTVSHAFHSPLMEPMLDTFRRVAESIAYHEPQIPLVSNGTGKLVGAEITTPAYWVRHVRDTVRFADGIATLYAQGVNTFLEIGPKPVLVGMAQTIVDGGLRILDSQTAAAPSTIHHPPSTIYLPSLREGQDAWQTMLTALGTLYGHGVAIQWAGLHQGARRQKLHLPTYPFQRQRYWIEPSRPPTRVTALTPLIDKMIKSPAIQETLFETALSLETLPFLTDHRIDDTVVAPGACHLTMLLSAAELAFGQQAYKLTDVMFPQPLVLDDAATRTAQIILTPQAVNGADSQATLRLISFVSADNAGAVATHATGAVRVIRQPQPATSTLSAIQARCTEAVALSPDHEPAIQFGPTFQWLDAAWRPPIPTADKQEDRGEVLVRLRRPDAVASLAGYPLHPGLLDACFQATGLMPSVSAQEAELYLPFALASLTLYQTTSGDTWWCHAISVGADKWNLLLFDQTGHLVAEIQEFQLRAVPRSALQTSRLRTDWLYTLAWQATPLVDIPAIPTTPTGWLLLGDDSELNRVLSAQLQAQAPGTPVCTAAISEVAVQKAAIRHLVDDLAARHRSVGVVFLSTLPDDQASPPVPAQALELSSALLHLTQALIDTPLSVHLWIVTQGCQWIVTQGCQPVAETVGSPPLSRRAQAATAAPAGALWGLGRTLAQEQPGLHPVCIDLAPAADATQQAILLCQEFAAGLPEAHPETQIAYRDGVRYVARLQPWQAPSIIDPAQPMRLQLQAYGSLEKLQWAPLLRRRPGPGEVEIEVKAAGLNFRDVLNALGMLQDYYATVLGITNAQEVGLGFECAGVVTAVGEGVRNFAVGDRVMGLGGAEGTFASYITVPAAQMTLIPAGISDTEAATIPLTFLTAWYGLVELARLQPGDRVLIHAAAGGVGQAAVQIAQAIGAEIFATASPGKWEFLRQQGITHVMNSRTLDFAAELRQLTHGRGVDVVLNSLNGAFIEQSVAVLGDGGRFVEIGKLGIWRGEQMQQQRPDVAYYPFDLGEALAAEPRLCIRLWQAIMASLNTGALKPLPYLTFPAQESVAAFRHMQGAKQIGKIVITFAEPAPVVLHQDATYLITGGLGALGLQIAQQLVADGAHHLFLTGRRGVTTDEQRQILEQLTAAGANLHVLPADMAKVEDVERLLHGCAQIAPLRGIVHAAGLLDDGVLTSQRRERFATVMQPKVDGAWHLHQLTAGMALDFFVCFSSSSSLLGSAGQSNYAAANAFLDTLMQERHAAGLPGVSINWGAWAAVGMAAGLQAQLNAQGMAMIAPEQGRLLFRYLRQQPVAQVGVLPMRRQQPTEEKQSKRATMREQLATLAPEERQPQLEAYLRREITAVLGLRGDTPIDPHTRLFDLGFDSLMAVEMKNKLEAGLACSLRSTLLFDYPTLSALTPYLIENALGFAIPQSAEAIAEAPAPVAASAATDLAEYSEDEMSDLLLAKLEKLGF